MVANEKLPGASSSEWRKPVPNDLSWSKGRSRRYAYYRCPNRDCYGVKIGKARLEARFGELLDILQPAPQFFLFR